MSRKISIVPVHKKDKNANDFLKKAIQGNCDFFSIVFFDDSVRIKNICCDIIVNENGSAKHIPCASSIDLIPGQRFKVNNFLYKVEG